MQRSPGTRNKQEALQGKSHQIWSAEIAFKEVMRANSRNINRKSTGKGSRTPFFGQLGGGEGKGEEEAVPITSNNPDFQKSEKLMYTPTVPP